MTENELPKWRRTFMRNIQTLETYETSQAAAEYETAKYGELNAALTVGDLKK